MAETSLARGYVFATMIIVIWTGFILVARLGGIGHLTPFDVVAVRMITASALVLPLWLYSGRYRRFDRRMIVLTLTGGLGYTLFVFSAFHLAPAAHAGILLSGLQPLAMAFCAWAVTGERPTSQRLVGIGVIVLGAGVLGMTVLQGGASSWAGDLLFIGAAFCWALYTVLARKWEVSPWVVTVNVALLASLAYLPVYVLALPKQLALASFGEIALQALYQGALAAVIQMVIYLRAVEILGASRMGVLVALVPITGALTAVPLLHEAITPALLVSLVLVSCGVVIGNGGGALFSFSLFKPRMAECPEAE